jgi:hypothetical protein
MTAEEIRIEIDRVCRSDWEKELAPLTERLRQTKSSETFHALFRFAAHSQDLGPAAPAALLLLMVNPRCPISCKEAIQEMLIDWDASIEELPFYLADQFGLAKVRATMAEMRPANTEYHKATYLDTIEYWLCRYEEVKEYKSRR